VSRFFRAHPGRGVAIEQTQFLQPLENPEWETALEATRIADLDVKFVRQSFANQQLVDFGALARSHSYCSQHDWLLILIRPHL